MIMPPRLRRLALTVHVACSLGWAGSLAAFLALAVLGLTASDPLVARAAYVANAAITDWVIVPLALAALLTGILQGLATPWGLFRHYWVVLKLMIVAASAFMLLIKAGPIGDIADLATQGALSPDDLPGLRISILLHALGGLIVLLWAAALGIYKPRGLTRYGWRRRAQGS